MAEIKDIRDRDALKAWFDFVISKSGLVKGQRIGAYLAYRSATRVLPIIWRLDQIAPNSNDEKRGVLRSIQAIIVASEASKSLNSEWQSRALSADIAASAFNSDRTSALAVSATYVTHNGVNDAINAVFGASEALSGFAGTSSAIWKEARLDAAACLSNDADQRPLWTDKNPLAEVWADIKSTTMSVPEGPTHWSFWRRWYDEALKGGPPRNPELLKAVALIDPEDWDKGPVFINDVKIPELQAEHARHIASTAAEVVRDEATCAFTEVAVSDLEDGLFRDARERANEAIADFRTFINRPQSPYGGFAEDLDLIETQIARTADRPIRCYENLADAMLVILDIAKYNGLETDGRVTRLVREFERSRRDLRADDDKIAAREARRIRIGYDELLDAEQADFRAMLTDFAHKSDDTLEAEMVEDEAAIADPETLPEVRDRALLRSSERMVQMDGIERDEAAKAKPSLEEIGKKADAVNKVAKAGETGFSVIGKIVEWFLT